MPFYFVNYKIWVPPSRPLSGWRVIWLNISDNSNRVYALFTGLTICYGVPQGSILGPLLFALYTYINDVPKIVSNCEPESYVDDTKLYLSFKSLDTDAALYTRPNTRKYQFWSRYYSMPSSDSSCIHRARMLNARGNNEPLMLAMWKLTGMGNKILTRIAALLPRQMVYPGPGLKSIRYDHKTAKFQQISINQPAVGQSPVPTMLKRMQTCFLFKTSLGHVHSIPLASGEG